MTMPAKLTLFLLAISLLNACDPADLQPIKVGVLHSLSGTMAISERPLVDAALLAIEDINRAGGVLGQPLEAVVADGASDPERFASETHRLIADLKVPVIFGCWTSTCRKAVKPVIEHFDHLWFYPLQYEGMEQSANIIYTGAAPNQQVIPAVQWALENLGKRVFLLGSDYVFPRTANRLTRDLVALSGGEVVGERYLALGATRFAPSMAEIASLSPDLIINTINGDSNSHLFPALRANPATAGTPVLSLSLAEPELNVIGPSAVPVHYTAWNYFQSLDNPKNEGFVARFRARFGADRVIGDPMQATYVGLQLWAHAVREAQTLEPAAVRKALKHQSMNAPEGIVSIDPSNNHLWKTARVGRARPDGQFQLLWSSPHPIRPEPFPLYRYREEWANRTDSEDTGQ